MFKSVVYLFKDRGFGNVGRDSRSGGSVWDVNKIK